MANNGEASSSSANQDNKGLRNVGNQVLIGTIEPFDCTKAELWDSWLERFENFTECNNIAEVKMAQMLINLSGPGIYEILKASAAPTRVKELTYKELLDILNNYFIPKPSTITSFYLFVQRNQLPEETVLMYFTELQKIAVHCEFGTLLDSMIVKRVICGLRDAALQREFLKEKEDRLTKKYVLEKSSISESARKNQNKIQDNMAEEEENSEISRLNLPNVIVVG